MSRHLDAGAHLDSPPHRGALEHDRARRPTSRRAGSLPLGLEVLLGICLVLTPVAALVSGWFAVSFQLFGATADAGDYRTAAGAYVASAGVLVLGALAARRHQAPAWLAAWALGWTAVLLVLGLSALSDATAAARAAARHGDTVGSLGGWQDGAFGVLAGPWVWVIVVLAAVALLPRRR